jgi:conserved hypothetical protein
MDEKNIEKTGCETVEEKVIAPKKNKKLRKILSTVLFILFNAVGIGVVLLIEIKNERAAFAGAKELSAILGSNFVFLIIAFGMYLLHVTSNTICFSALIERCGYGRRPWLALRLAVLGKYYDSITPWNTGGQPYQIYYMTKSNIDAPTACTLPVVKYAIRIFTINAFMLATMIILPMGKSLLIQIAAFINIFNTMILPLVLIIFSKNVPLMLKFSRGVTSILYKLKIVKDYDKGVQKAQDLMDSFLAAFKYLGKHKSLILIIGVASIVDLVAVGATPFLVVRALGGNADFFKTLSNSFYATMSSSIVPTPGGSGAAEGSFYSIFSSAVPVGYLFWGVLLWRIFVFYLPIFAGLVFQFIDWIVGKSKVSLVKEITWKHKKTFTPITVDHIEEGGIGGAEK